MSSIPPPPHTPWPCQCVPVWVHVPQRLARSHLVPRTSHLRPFHLAKLHWDKRCPKKKHITSPHLHISISSYYVARSPPSLAIHCRSPTLQREDEGEGTGNQAQIQRPRAHPIPSQGTPALALALKKVNRISHSHSHFTLLAGWLAGWLVAWIDGWLDGWMDGWVGGSMGTTLQYVLSRHSLRVGRRRHGGVNRESGRLGVWASGSTVTVSA